MEIRINEKSVTLGKLIGEGGEARVYKLDDSTLAKIYRMPNDPELADDQVAAARLRVIVAQRKLPLFPRDLPTAIVAPQALIRETRSNLVVGYTMPFVKNARPLSDYKSATVRDERGNGVTDQSVMGVFRDLATAVRAVHARGTVIGDFNDTNVLVTKGGPCIIDADSMQYGPFRSKVFMPAFVDPNRCDPNAKTLELVKTHDQSSDWYAWTVMLFQSLHFIHPYGGVYRSKGVAVPPTLRGLPQHRISVYHPEVKYPAQARSLDDVPQALSNFFKAVFVEGLRPEPTDALFEGLAFKSDGSFDKSRSTLAVAKSVQSTKTVTEKTLQEFSGKLLAATVLPEGLTSLEFVPARKMLQRNGKHVTNLKTVHGAGLEFLIAGAQTVLTTGTEAIAFSEGWTSGLKIVTKPGVIPHIDNGVKKYAMITGSTAGTVYWDGRFKQVVGRSEPAIKTLDIDADVLPLRFWASGDLLFVLCSRNGKLGYLLHHMTWDVTLFQQAYFVAVPEKISWAGCHFNAENVWLYLLQDSGRATCDVLDGKGKVVTSSEVEPGKGWSGNFESGALSGKMLFLPSEAGITRATVADGKLALTEFPYATKQEDDGRSLLVGDKIYAACFEGSNQVLELTVS